MLGIRRIDRVRNEEVLQRVQSNNLSNLMYKRQLRSLGHWVRKDDIIKLNYNKHIQNITHLITEELQRKAMNRQEWKRDVVGRFDL